MSFVGSRRAKCRVLSAENCHFETHRLQFTGLLGNSGVTLRSLRRLVNWPKKCIDFGYPLVALTRAVAFSLCTKPTMLNDAVRCVGGINASYARRIQRERPQNQDFSWRFCLTKFNLFCAVRIGHSCQEKTRRKLWSPLVCCYKVDAAAASKRRIRTGVFPASAGAACGRQRVLVNDVSAARRRRGAFGALSGKDRCDLARTAIYSGRYSL